MKEAKKITREEADKIIADWHNGNNPHKRVVAGYKGQWYDLRELTEEEIDEFMYKVSGIKPTPANTMNVNVK